MKKITTIILNILLIAGMVSQVSFANEKMPSVESKRDADVKIVTVSDAEAYLASHLKNKNIALGTEAYMEYLVDLLMFEDDEVLQKSPQYEDIKIYASEYLSQLNDPSKTREERGKVLLNSREQQKTIATIKEEAIKENVEDLLTVPSKAEKVQLAQSTKGYSATNAVKYARKWAKGRNPAYNNHGANKDCTNFVSQCVKAGGKAMTTPSYIPTGIKETTAYWYSVQYNPGYPNDAHYKWKESTSFIRVSDFYTYWKKKGETVKSYSNKSQLQNGASIGEVVQIKNGGGKWCHSIIITGGSKGARTYCGHSTNRKDEPVKNISNAVSYRGIKF